MAQARKRSLAKTANGTTVSTKEAFRLIKESASRRASTREHLQEAERHIASFKAAKTR